MTLEFIKSNIGLCSTGFLLILLTLVQITPIKINPWSAISKWIGRAINKEVIEKVDALSIDVKNSKTDNDEKWASLKRSCILRFGDEIRHGTRHSKEHFDQILLDISDYEEYCESHPGYRNNVAAATIELVKSTYQDRLKNNDFL